MVHMRKIERLQSGRYKVRFRHGTNRAGTGPRQASETFSTRRAAEDFARWLDALGPQDALDRLYAGEQQAAVPSLDQVAAEHVGQLPGIEHGTRVQYERLWTRVWSPRFGTLPANQITRDDVNRAVNDIGSRCSRKTLQNYHALLRAVLGRAVEHGYLPSNPATGTRLPRGAEGSRTEMRILDQDELAALFAAVPDHYRPLVRFLAGTGCRWGEAVALTVADVSLPNVRIRRARKFSPDGHYTIGPTKTPRSNRTVALPVELHDEIRAQCAGKPGDALVFTAVKGGLVHHRPFWSKVWVPAASQFQPRPRIHDLRHSHASHLLAAGVPIHIVQARLGHSSITVTVNTYGHLFPDAQQMAANAASLAFRLRGELEP